MAEPIEIIIRQGGSGTGGVGFGSGTGGAISGSSASASRLSAFNEGAKGLNKMKSVMNRQNAALIAVAGSQIKGFIEYGIANYGDFTGNYVRQQGMRNVLNTYSYLTSEMKSGASIGASVGGGWGALAGAAIGATVLTYKIMKDYKSLQVNIAKANLQITHARAVSGSSIASGSRGTYD